MKIFSENKKNSFWLILFVILAGALLLAVPDAKAITLIPPTLEIGLTPGQTVNTVIKLFNETPNTVQLFTEARNFTAKNDTGQPEFDFNQEPIGLSTWMQVEKGPITLASGERYEVPVTISPPADADPGGHYAALFFTSAPPDEGQVKVASKIGTLILANVEGDVTEAGNISEFIIQDGQKFFNRLPVGFTARFQNTGNVYLKPSGNLEVKNIFGKTTDRLEFNASKGATLSNTTRKYEVVWEKSIVNQTADNFWSKFWQEYGNERNNFAFGKYTAVLNIAAGTNDNVTDTAQIGFWVIPWHIILAWGLVAIVGILLLIWLFKKYNAWIIKKAKK